MRIPAALASAQSRQTRYIPPFFAIFVCTTVAARRRITSSREWSVETDSSAMIGIDVARASEVPDGDGLLGRFDVVGFELPQQGERVVVGEGAVGVYSNDDPVPEAV